MFDTEELTLAIGLCEANMLDVLDQRNNKGYHEGYRDALIAIRDKLQGK